MNFLALIEAKREGCALSSDQIKSAIEAYVRREIPDYQMAAFLMAVYFRGLNVEETRTLTLAMRDSGEVLKFPADDRPLVDKHSTGGVGDKVSLVLAPLLACLGFRVPMISGRGLGITGGTLDKMESIPGFKVDLSPREIVEQVQSVGCVICGQTDRMVPADKELYALRDATGTVVSIPLITASILSKKLAEGISALVLDAKFGTAAFMKTPEQAGELAQSIVRLANDCGVKALPLVTNMDRPLGRAAGNWLEVKEAVQCLEGQGPEDLRELVIACASLLMVLTGKTTAVETMGTEASRCLASQVPRRKWDEMIAAQGADIAAFERKLKDDSTAPVVQEAKAARNGFISRCNARVIGEIVRDLGGGRITKDSSINHEVGIDNIRQIGERVQQGDVLCRIHATTAEGARNAEKRIGEAFEISDAPPVIPPLFGGSTD